MNFKNGAKTGTLAFLLCGALFPTNNLNEKKDLCPYPNRLERRLQQENPIKNNLPNKYAVIIRKGYENRHVEDVMTQYETLKDNGYKIYILTEDGKKQDYYPVDDIASKESLIILLRHLSKKIDKKDKFLFSYIGHGGKESFNSDENQEIQLSGFSLNNKWTNEIELDFYLSVIDAKEKIFFFDNCSDGRFSTRLGKENAIALSSSESSEQGSWSLNHNSFCWFFFKSFRKNSGADMNHDGFISISEAYNFAKKNHLFSRLKIQNPQIIYDKNKIDPSKVGLN